MATFEIHMNTDLSEWTATATDAGNFSAEVAAAMYGTAKGGQFVINDANPLYGDYQFVNWTRLRFGFGLDLNSLTMANGDSFRMIGDITSGGTDYRCNLTRTDPNYTISIGVHLDDASYLYTAAVTVPDSPVWIEIDMKRSSGSNDGFVKIWVDTDVTGAVSAEQTGLDDDTRDYDGFVIGAINNIDAGTSGTFYIDEVFGNDTGAAIGPPSVPVPPKFMHYTQTRNG